VEKTKHWKSFRCATDVDSVLRTEMGDLETQEENAPKRVLLYRPMVWLDVIRPHRRDDDWPDSLCWTTFVLAVSV
jgi:hypothetical protein